MIEITPELSELVGMHVGDGTLYKTGRGLVWEMRGSLDEKEYYIKHVAPLLKRITGLEFTPKFRSGGKNGCFGIQTSNKALTSLFINLGFNPGRKTHTVTVPHYIKQANNIIKCAFIRGYFDTDGCLRFERKNNNPEYKYPRIEFSTVSSQLAQDVSKLLTELDFRHHKWGKREYKIGISGAKSLEKFIIEISPKNTKHLKKHLFWKTHGYRSPNAAVAYSKFSDFGRARDE